MQARFDAGVRSRAEAACSGKAAALECDELREVRAYLRGEGAVGEGSGAADEEEEDVVMTQQVAINTKCPVLQVEMEASGDLRPMTHAGCPAACVFSHRGISDYLRDMARKKLPAQCPVSGAAGHARRSPPYRRPARAPRRPRRTSVAGRAAPPPPLLSSELAGPGLQAARTKASSTLTSRSVRTRTS